MEQVAAKQRIKVAAKDHMTISRVHFRLHSGHIVFATFVLLVLAMAALIIVGIAQPNVISQWEVTGLQATSCSISGCTTTWHWRGTVRCRNIETEELRRFRLRESEFCRLQVGYRILLRDDGWFDGGNNLAAILLPPKNPGNRFFHMPDSVPKRPVVREC